MCYLNSLAVKARQLAERYAISTQLEFDFGPEYRLEAYLHPYCPIVTMEHKLELFQWGLVPFWVKSRDQARSIMRGTMNARAEDIFDKPSYRTPILRRRCLIPSTGYFEYHYPDPSKKLTVPYYLYLPDEKVFSMGGIYEYWRDPETGEMVRTFSQITVPANPLAAQIHNGGKNPGRMPLIIMPEDEQAWLNPALDREDIDALMQTLPEKYLAAYPVRKDFKKKDSTNASITDKITLYLPKN